jgi:hypothetical protein
MTTQWCESVGINASGPEFVRRSKEMAERNVNASHRLGPIYVTLAGDRAIAQLVAIIDIPFKLAGVDRPDLVDALVREIYGWAGLTPPR